MKYEQLDNDVYLIEQVFDKSTWQSLRDEFHPQFNNWIFSKKEFTMLPESEQSGTTSKYPTWGCVYKPTSTTLDEGLQHIRLGDNLNFLHAGSTLKLHAEKMLQRRLDLFRINTNIQFFGQESTFHKDGHDTDWSFLVFMNNMWDSLWGGAFDIHRRHSIPYIPNNGILFRASLLHKGSAPNRLCPIERTSIAFTYEEVR